MSLGLNGRFYAARHTGVQRFAREVAARLSERESLVLLLPRNASAPALVTGSARVVRGRLIGAAWEQLELPSQARRARCDVLLHLANAGPARGGAGREVLVLHDLTPLTNPEWFTRTFAAWFGIMARRAAHRAARLLVPSAWARRETSRMLGVPEARVGVVSEGVAPFDVPAPADAVARCRARWQLPERYLLAVGGSNPRKNVRWLLDVLARWPGGADRAPALVVAGEALAGIHRAAPLPRRAGVRVVGHVSDDELRALYTGAVALCYPSLAEGFGRPPLEAMGCGAPVVAAPYGAARETLDDAAQILPLDAGAWAAALARLDQDPAERSRWVERGRRHAATFTWDAAADRVAATCREATA